MSVDYFTNHKFKNNAESFNLKMEIEALAKILDILSNK